MKSNAAAWLGWALFAMAGCNTAASAGSAKDLQGVVELDTVTLAFEVGGRVRTVGVDEGDHVEGRVVLAALDESLARPERDARAAELAAAKAELALLEAGARGEDIRAVQAEISAIEQQEQVLTRQRTRQAQLTVHGAAPTAQLDEFDAQASALEGKRKVLEQKLKVLRTGARKQELEAARARVQALEAGLHAIDARLERFELVHEGAADVLEVYIKAGEVVAPGAPAVALSDLDHPYVDVFVPQSELAGVKIGLPMWVKVDALQQPLRAQVERVGYKTEFTPRYLFSEKERATLVVRVRVRVDDPHHQLHAGVPAFVTPRLEEK